MRDSLRRLSHPIHSGCVLMITLALAGCVSGGNNEAGSTTLDWKAPLTRVDGSKLYPGEIQGYRVYYRRSGDARFDSHTIDDAATTRWTPEALPTGDYLFAVATVDTSGLESPRSETLRVTIP